MKYFSKNKKWMAYLILLTFLFTCVMPTNLGSMNSMAMAAGNSGSTNASTGTITFRIENGHWGKNLATAGGDLISVTETKIVFKTTRHTNGQYYYKCSLQGGKLESFLLSLLGNNISSYVVPDTGYVLDTKNASWIQLEGGIYANSSQGSRLKYDSGTNVTSFFRWLTTTSESNQNYTESHFHDSNAIKTGETGFAQNTVYVIRCYKGNVNITYADGYTDPDSTPDNGLLEGRVLQGPTAVEFETPFANFPQCTEPTRTGHKFAGWKWYNNNTPSQPVEYVNQEDGGNIPTAATSDFLAVAQWIPADTLTYNPNGGTGTMDPTTDYEGEVVTVKANEFTKAGYTFTGWNTAADGSGIAYKAGTSYTLTPKADVLYAQWSANTDTPYKVEHYLQNVSGDGYTLQDTDNLTGTTEATVTATAKTYEGFTFDADSQLNVLSGTIAADGSLVLKLYYERNNYDVTYSYTNTVEGTSALPEKATYKYGQEVTVATDAEAPGYTFSGWTTSDATISDGKFTMPDKDVKLVGSFTANSNTPYKVEHYLQSLNNDGTPASTYQLKDTENLTGTTGKTVTATAKSYPGFTLKLEVANTVQSGTITGDGQLVLRLYYNRNTVDANEAKILKTDANGNALAGATFTFNGATLEASAPQSIIQTLATVITGEDAVNNQYLIPMQLVYGVVYPVVETAAPAGYTGVAPFYVTLNADANALVLCDAEGKALDNSANVSITGLTITVKNTINSYGYTVNYYKDEIAAANLLGSDAGTGTFEATIPYTDGKYLPAGYVTPGAVSGQATITAVVENNVLNVVYAPIDYKVTYKYENPVPEGATILPQETVNNHVGDAITVAPNAEAEGFVFSGWKVVEPSGIEIVDGKFTMPAADVTLVGSWDTADDTPYTVNYYYQDRTGAYSTMFTESNKTTTTGVLVFAETTPNENHVTTPSLYAFNPYGFTTDENGNTVKTNTQARVAADGSTVLNAFFDQKFRVIFKYADESMLTYNVIKDTGYVYGLGDAVVFPAFTEDMEEAVWTTEPDGGMKVSFIDAIDEDTVALFGEGDNTLVLYTKAKVKPLAVGDLVIRKVVTGDQAPAGASFNFTLEVKVNLPDKTLTAEEAKKLQGYNSDVIFAEKARDNAEADLRDAIAVFGGNAKATTVSAYEFIMTDDSDETLFGYTTTGSAYQYTTGSVYEFDAYDSFRVKGDKVEKGLLEDIIDFFKALAGAETQPTDSRELLTMLAEKVNSTTNSAISFRITDAYNLMDAVKAFAEADAEYTKAEADRDSFLNKAGLAKWITINGERYDLVKVEGEDYYTTTGSMITFTLKDGESKGFTFDVTSGSTIRYVVTEVNDDKLVSVHEHDITLDDKGDQVWGNGILVDGKVAIGSITTGSAAGFTFTNAYGDKVITPPEIITPPNTPPYVPPTTPEEIIDDPEVPLDEPEVPEEPVIEPGEEIEEPEVPLGDAPRTGDTNNAVPFMVLMLFAMAGLAVTRRRFN